MIFLLLFSSLIVSEGFDGEGPGFAQCKVVRDILWTSPRCKAVLKCGDRRVRHSCAAVPRVWNSKELGIRWICYLASSSNKQEIVQVPKAVCHYDAATRQHFIDKELVRLWLKKNLRFRLTE